MEFYYEIKARVNGDDTHSEWLWPPVWSGSMEALNRKDARTKIESDYNQKFVARFSKSNPEAPFLVNIKEMTPFLQRRFTEIECIECGNKFTMNEKYITKSGTRHNLCSEKCESIHIVKMNNENMYAFDSNNYLNPPVIYKITNIQHDKCYIGKSIRSFTLRWWEHIKAGKLLPENETHKFYSAIRDSKLTDWTYNVIEVIDSFPEDVLDKEQYILTRESYWINYFNSVDNGYNSLISKI